MLNQIESTMKAYVNPILLLIPLLIALPGTLQLYAQVPDAYVESTSYGIYPSLHSGYADSIESTSYRLRMAIGGFTDTAFSNSYRIESGIMPARMIPVVTIVEKGRRHDSRLRADSLQSFYDSVCQNDTRTFSVIGSDVIAASDGGYAWMTDTSRSPRLDDPNLFWDKQPLLSADSTDLFVHALFGDTAFYVVAYNGNYQSIPDTIRLAVERLTAHITLGKIAIDPEDTTTEGMNARKAWIDVVLASQYKLDSCNVDSAVVTVSLNKTLMFADSITNGRILSKQIDGNDQVLTLGIRVDTTALNNGDTLLTKIYGTILLGNSDRTPIIAQPRKFPDSLIWYTNDAGYLALWHRETRPYVYVTTTADSGEIMLIPICIAGGQRLLDFEHAPSVIVTKVAPNPGRGNVAVTVRSLLSEVSSLEVYTLYGERVLTVLPISTVSRGTDEGEVTFEVDAHRLPVGTYQLVVRGNGAYGTAGLSVVR